MWSYIWEKSRQMECEEANDFVWECERASVPNQQLQLCHTGSTAQKTKKVILFTMADWFYTPGYAAFRASLTKTIYKNQHLKWDSGPQSTGAGVGAWQEPKYLSLYVYYCIWSTPAPNVN